jgi:hypothetical protein
MSIDTPTDLIGRHFEIVFPDFTSRIHVLSRTRLVYEIVVGADAGRREPVNYQGAELRPGLFTIGWQEAALTSVHHVWDAERGIAHSAITTPDHRFLRLTGDIREVYPPAAN